MGPTIYYIRHGQTDWNAELRFQGQQDIPLNENGQQQAHRNGITLAAIVKADHTLPFICSPMLRTRQTMERLQQSSGFTDRGYSIDERLIEASYGDWEGKRLPDVKQEFPDLHRKRKTERWTFNPPNGESHQMLETRVGDWYSSVTEDSIVVAHGVVGRVLRYLLLDLDPQEAGEFVFPQDKICILKSGSEKFV